MKICIIDDEVTVTAALSDILTEADFEVFCLNQPKEAIAFIKEKNPDCVLLDVKMPQFNGIDVLKQIKKEFEGMPVIMLSGHAELSSISEAISLGAANFVSKPWDNTLLKNVINEAMKRG